MRAHSQPNGRPIHPECPMLDDNANDCECSHLHDYCETFGEHARRLAIAERLDARTVTATSGRGPDVDDDATAHRAVDSSVTACGEFDGGFWKHSEFLACNQGKPMRNLSNYGTGITWQRARESMI